MEINRRDFIKVGATMLGGASMGIQIDAQAEGGLGDAKEYSKSVPPLAGKFGHRFATCIFEQNGAPRIGIVLDDERVIDLVAEAKRQKMILAFSGNSMLSLIASGDVGMAQVVVLIKNTLATSSKLRTANQVKLLSPVPKPERTIYCVGWNYLAHFEEGKEARGDKGVTTLPEHPVFFTKATHTMNGPFDAIPYDASYTATADWEAELAVVIGKKGRNISEERAMEYVFGYSAFNDTTVREVQQKKHGGQWFKGKSIDGYGPMGPWIVTAGGVILDDVRIICRVNGVEKQNASYEQMYFKIPRIIAELSRGLTLEPGDIIATGTPPGVGYSRNPPEFLKPGDVMETEIAGVGVIRNTVKTEAWT
jgi:2-keto-4-pentenoate hydratase/2-oxohepta-3-ene-1,7-dioic acid hydratase in catechol pathway